jgi:hypothetical protein
MDFPTAQDIQNYTFVERFLISIKPTIIELSEINFQSFLINNWKEDDIRDVKEFLEKKGFYTKIYKKFQIQHYECDKPNCLTFHAPSYISISYLAISLDKEKLPKDVETK